MSALSRRRFLARAAGVGAAALAPPSLRGLAACAVASRRALQDEGGYGALVPSSDCPELALPRGFRCVKLSQSGVRMSDRNPTPGAFDGMAAFALPNGNVRLIRNHEMRDGPDTSVPIGDRAKSYDPIGCGGTTSLEVRVRRDGTRELVRDFVSLSGTIVNCAGGPTPWGSWLTCEETTAGLARGWQRPHGYVFDVAAGAEGEVDPLPLRALGRLVHEAVAVDPRTGIVYETEDMAHAPAWNRPGSGFYRFLPRRRDLRLGGQLQALALQGRPNHETFRGQRPGTPLPVTWVDIADPDPSGAESDSSAVFRQALARGAAIFQRLEGCWYGEGSVFFNATAGGDAGLGQVWQYRPRDEGGGELILVFESPSRRVLKNPDNITVSPRGGLLLCEDSWGDQYLRGITPRGGIFDFARNIANTNEFAGACFSPDGETLFVNVQGFRNRAGGAPSWTFAIWGPWPSGAL